MTEEKAGRKVSNWGLTLSQVSEVTHPGKHHSVKTRQISRHTKAAVRGRGRQVKCMIRGTGFTRAWRLEDSEEAERTKQDDIAAASKEDLANSMEEPVINQRDLGSSGEGETKTPR